MRPSRAVWSDAFAAPSAPRPSQPPSSTAAICTRTNAAHASNSPARSTSVTWSAAVTIHSNCVVTFSKSSPPERSDGEEPSGAEGRRRDHPFELRRHVLQEQHAVDAKRGHGGDDHEVA